MNHNFLPFEVTELLPKENPYEVIKVWSMYYVELYAKNPTWKGDKTKPMLLDYGVSLQHHSDYTVRNAYTIIDALTYLEEQGYYLTLDLGVKYAEFTYKIVIKDDKGSNAESVKWNYKYYNSRTEAYIAGIEHCLNLMKNETNKS